MPDRLCSRFRKEVDFYFVCLALRSAFLSGKLISANHVMTTNGMIEKVGANRYAYYVLKQ